MEVMRSIVVRMLHSSVVSEVRGNIAGLAQLLGWNADAVGTASLIATELASNLVKHARDGTLVLNCGTRGALGVLQLVAIDRGPGMADIARCMQDGYSTAGSPGTGLGAVQRMSTRFDVTSLPGKGTVFFAEYAPKRADGARTPEFDVGAFSIPREGESECGDAWSCRTERSSLHVMVCDGLGHGPAAAAASAAAAHAFRTSPDLAPRALMEHAHEALRATRGAALAFATIDKPAARVRFCGVGNISAMVVEGTSARHLISHDGIVGHRAARIAEFETPFGAGDALVVHSDGVSARWRPEEWPGIWLREPLVAAATLWRDHGRATDDATVLVARAGS